MKRQQCVNHPAMIGDPSGHCRRRHTTATPQTRVRTTKIVDGTDQVHAMLQRQRVTHHRPAAPHQWCQALMECRVQSLDVGRVDHPSPLRAAPERLDTRGRASSEFMNWLRVFRHCSSIDESNRTGSENGNHAAACDF
jgi:hypothetical protein